MTTYQQIADRTATAIPEHLLAQAEIPVCRSVQQGDVWILPTTARPRGTAQPIPPAGVNVVQGDIGRNRHILSADPDSGVMWTPGPVTDPDRDYGHLLVPAGRTAVLTHTGEHGSVAVPEGTYRVLGQLDPQTHRRVAD